MIDYNFRKVLSRKIYSTAVYSKIRLSKVRIRNRKIFGEGDTDLRRQCDLS